MENTKSMPPASGEYWDTAGGIFVDTVADRPNEPGYHLVIEMTREQFDAMQEQQKFWQRKESFKREQQQWADDYIRKSRET